MGSGLTAAAAAAAAALTALRGDIFGEKGRGRDDEEEEDEEHEEAASGLEVDLADKSSVEGEISPSHSALLPMPFPYLDA